MAPEAFEEPESYVIQKTPGVFSLHQVARYIFKLFDRQRNTAPTVDDLVVMIEDLGDAATAEYWQRGNPEGASMAGSMAGFKIIADTLIEELQDRGHTL